MSQHPGERASPEEQERGERKPKCCLGALYFSEARYAAQKPPVSCRCHQRFGSAAPVLLPAQPPTGPPPALPHCLAATDHHPGLPACRSMQVCTGFAKRLKPTDDAAQLPTDSVPGGDFK